VADIGGGKQTFPQRTFTTGEKSIKGPDLGPKRTMIA